MRHLEHAGRLFHFDHIFKPGPSVFGNIVLHQIGELCCEAGFEIKPHRQWCDEISSIVSGSGAFVHNGERRSVRAGDLVYSGLDTVHAIEAASDGPLRYIYIGFTLIPQPEEPMGEIGRWLQHAPYRFSRQGLQVMQPFQRCMTELFSRTTGYERIIRNALEEIVILSYRAFTIETATTAHYTAEKSPASVGQAVYLAMRYVENHVCELKHVRTIAEQLGYSGSYLSRCFRQRTGMTLQRYVNHKKVEKACEWFSYGDMSVQQVAEQLNYETIQSFSKAFSRIMGCPPSQYKTAYSKTALEEL